MKKKDTEAEIAEKRAKRAEKRAEKAAVEEFEKYVLSYIKENVPEKDFEKRRSDFEHWKKEYLRNLKRQVRELRKRAVDEGIEKFSLPDKIKIPFYLAFTKLDYNRYRAELCDLSIEGLKVQDREVKIFVYDFNDKLLESGFLDWGWIVRMLGKQYVSRYAWALLRKHSDKLSQLGGDIIGNQLDEWAQDPDTWAKWERLASEDGKPVDMRELYPRCLT